MSNALPLFVSPEPIRHLPIEARPIFSVSKSLKTLPRSALKSGKIAFPTMDGLSFEKVKQITFLEASGNYTMLHFLDDRQVLVSKTLSDVEAMLPPDSFVRIHRSHTLHLKHIKKYVRGKGGYVVLQNGMTLTVSAGQKDFFLESVKGFFG